MDISGQWQFPSLYLCKTKPKCTGCRKSLNEQTFSHLPYLSDTLAKTDLFFEDNGQQTTDYGLLVGSWFGGCRTTDNRLLGGSRLFLRLQDYESTRPQAGRLPAQYLQQKKTLKKTIKVIVYFVKY